MRKVLFVSLMLALSMPAMADAAAGTPLFTCTPPTQGFNALNGVITLTTLPATGPTSLARYAFYVDPPALVGHPPNDPRVIYIPSATTAQKIVNAPNCSWQTIAGEIAPGAHTIKVTAIDATGLESPATTALAFTVPSPVYQGPVAPSGAAVN